MPTVSASQKRLMEAAAHTPGGYGGVPQAVGKEFVAADSPKDQPHTELDYARLIRYGEAPSPQYVNNHWLFDLRITGTGEAYRASLGQGVYRPPENYLNPEFLARCNGLPVTWEHPAENKLNSEEFSNRVIGTIMLPYIKNDEVWGIARIYDNTAAEEMLKGGLSTSPSIIFKTADNTYNAENNTVLEGNGALIDHLAICNVGVWDKGGDPAGVNVNNNEVNAMENEEEKKEPEVEVDTSERLLKLLESMDARLSKIEAAEKAEVIASDTDEAVHDGKNPPDFEEKKEPAEEAFADSAEFKALKAKIALLENATPRHRSNDDFNALAIAQNAAATVYSAFGDSMAVTRPMDAETVVGYRKRMVKGLQKYAKGRHATIDVVGIADEAILSMVEEAVYADALQVARAPTSNGLPNGMPRAVKGVDEVGRPFIHYTGGDPLAVFKSFRQLPRQVVALRDPYTKH